MLISTIKRFSNKKCGPPLWQHSYHEHVIRDYRGKVIGGIYDAVIQMSGVFAELELRIIRARVRSGMANAKAKGAKIGRPQTTLEDVPALFLRHYPAYKAGQLNVSELARVCDLSRTTTYKYIGLLEGSTAISH